jgi:hypothetical protein
VGWGAPENPARRIDGEPDVVSGAARSLSGAAGELGRGSETTTALLRPGTSTVEAIRTVPRS